jgi:hypothetical protein
MDEKRKEYLKNYMKEYNKTYKKKHQEQVLCYCGGTYYSLNNKERHFKTKKHQSHNPDLPMKPINVVKNRKGKTEKTKLAFIPQKVEPRDPSKPITSLKQISYRPNYVSP